MIASSSGPTLNVMVCFVNVTVKISCITNEIGYIYELSDFVFSLSRYFIGVSCLTVLSD